MNIDKEAAKRFGLIVGSLVGVFVIVISAILFAYLTVASGNETALATKQPVEQEGQATPAPSEAAANNDKPSSGLEELFKPPARTTALFIGLDEGGLLADVQQLVTFDAVNNRIDIIQIPRDTYVVLPPEEVRSIQQTGRYCPSDGVMKINELHSYAGSEKGAQYLERQMERMFGVEIDYYVTLNPATFRDVIDAIDGVWFTVRPEGFYYNPPDQEIEIAVPGGYQKLNGRQAEGVVRFREGVNAYANGDIGRMQTQREFMKALAEQVLNTETLMNSMPSLLSTMINYVKTDFGIDSIPRYLDAIKSFNLDSLHFHQLAGTAPTINGISYFQIDEDAASDLIYEVFHKADLAQDATAETVDLRVQVLNGGAAAGAAGRMKEKLEAAGYTVAETGNYSGTQRTYTRIQVRSEANGKPFVPFCKSAVVELDDSLPDGIDVVIILGKNE